MIELFVITYFLFGIGIFISAHELIKDDSSAVMFLGFLVCVFMSPLVVGLLFGEWSKTVEKKK